MGVGWALPLAGLALVMLLLRGSTVMAQDAVAIPSAEITSLQAATGSERLALARDLGVLGKVATLNGLSESYTASLLATQKDLTVLANGGLRYSCTHGIPVAKRSTVKAAEVRPAAPVPVCRGAGVRVSQDGGCPDDEPTVPPPPPGLAFALHSRLSATKKIYLDFTGCDLSKCATRNPFKHAVVVALS